MHAVTPGRREQHKMATRRALQDAALRLFDQHGYAQTTVHDIATAAGVTERTFFRYFPSKEDLVLGDVLDLIPVLQKHVRARPRRERPFTAVLNGLLAVAGERGAGIGVLFSGPPAQLLSERRRPGMPVLREFEDALADTLAERLNETRRNDPPESIALRASVLARASVAAMRSALIAYFALPEHEKTPQAAIHWVRQAFDVLQPQSPNRPRD